MKSIIIDSINIDVFESKSILQVAKDHDIDIPSLCGLNTKGEKVACDVCVVEVDGEIKRSCELTAEPGMIINTQSPALTTHRQTALSNILSDHYADCLAPCQTACPAGVDVQSYLHFIAQNEHKKAVEVIKRTLPMPLSIGRVCPAFCETECRRGLVDEPIAIRQLKRHASDIDLHAQESYTPPKKAAKGKKIAVVGSGPGGLTCGYYLTNEGYEVTVLESMPAAGGWLRYGIPEYRLPKSILDKEIEIMCKNGMTIELNKHLGTDFSLSQLTQEFDAVCMAIGASQAVDMKYEGSDLDGCYLGVDYLKDFTTVQSYTTGKKVAVIGGGNTAIDCARTAARTGADTTIIYRRTRAEMPAEEYEIVEAEHEGVKFHYLTNPVENIADSNGRVTAIKLEKMALGEADSSGRRRPEPTGEYFTEAFDTVIPAVSQKPDVSFLEKEELELPLTRWLTADANDDTMHSGINNIFCIGDFRRGPATAVEAVADGRIAAEAIDRFFNGDMENIPVKAFNSQKEKKTAQVETTQYQNIVKVMRKVMPELTTAQREQSFEEVETGFDNRDAIAEAERCLECACQVNTNCDLRDLGTEYKVESEDLFAEDRKKFAIDDSSEFIVFDRNRCISCGQCVDVCNETNVHNVIKFEQNEDGSSAGRPQCRPGFDNTFNMGDSNCVQCGACVQACPVGALVDARDKSQGRVEMLRQVDTICTYCGVGCKLTMFVDDAKNKIRYVQGSKNSPVNEGMLCVKGRFGFDFIQSKQRLDVPLIRKDGVLQPASWEEAINLVADKFSSIKASKGSNALAGFSSAKTTNEDNYVFQKLVRREFETNNLDHCARLCHSTTVTGLEASLGSGAMTNDIPSIKHSDVIFIIGSDTTSAHPIIGSHIKQAIRHHGARLIVADPKKIKIADDALLYVAQRPGTDVMLLNGIMHQIIINGWQDESFIAEKCEGFEELRDEVSDQKYSAENVELITGVKAKDVIELARLIGTAEKTAIYYSMGITQHTTGHDNVRSVANLQLLCGNIGIEGGGINPLRGQSNVQGACDMGALPNNYPGYQKLSKPEVQEKFAKAWDSDTLPKEEGLTLTEIVEGAYHGSVNGLYIMGENPVLSDPNQAHVIEALENIDFLVVQDIFMTETAHYADVVLPSYSFAEKSGHFTNTERRVQRLNPALTAPGEAREDWKIIQDIANAMGGKWNYQSVAEITQEIADVTPQYTGITWDRIGEEGIQWPCREVDGSGTRIMHTEQILRGKGQLAAIEFKYAAERPDEEYPMVLTTGRLLEQYHTGTMTRKTQGLNNLAGPRVMISVEDAERLNISNSEMIRVSSRRGVIETPAFVTKRMQTGVIFVPFHFAEAPANALTSSSNLDPYAKIPEFKVSAARIEKLELVDA